uniref:Git3 domain-containing protein n=1 Tax=Steinernema glaseri TaxID=37863 RepID=A0A1I8A853_9BILA
MTALIILGLSDLVVYGAHTSLPLEAIEGKRILHCDFKNESAPWALVAVDAIIFDVGLFHSLWGIDGCIAQHLDGGYGRFCWCTCHTVALVFCLPFAFVKRPRPIYLWPLLIQQSAYGIGLLILSLAALPRVLPTFMGDLNNAPLLSILAYLIGTMLNFFLLYIFWHWYWYVEEIWNSARKIRNDQTIVNPNIRSKRWVPRPTPELDEALLRPAPPPLQVAPKTSPKTNGVAYKPLPQNNYDTVPLDETPSPPLPRKPYHTPRCAPLDIYRSPKSYFPYDYAAATSSFIVANGQATLVKQAPPYSFYHGRTVSRAPRYF